ncbi:MAG: DUF3604 domain-containing protein [Parachlamydiales bacterium]
MRRSIGLCEPSSLRAGEIGTWRFVFQTANALKAGAKFKFDMGNLGRDIDWEAPQVNLKAASNVIYAEVEGQKPVAAKEVEAADSITPHYEFELPSNLKVGESFTIVVGAPPAKAKQSHEKGNRAQLFTQRRRTFHLYLDPKGTGSYGEAEPFQLDVRGSELANIRVLAPSLVARNKRFDITIRFEDEFGNLTSDAPDDTLIDLSYENLRENLNWKLYVPETGFVTLPNLYFREEGIYRIRLENVKTKEIFLSAPVKCLSDIEDQIFWGLLHGESERYDSAENVESYLRVLRDDLSLNFASTSCFDSPDETSNEVWRLVNQNIQSFNEDDRFTALLGFQWTGESPAEGTRQMIYTKDNKPLLRSKDLKNNQLAKIYRSIPAGELLSIPTFTMGGKHGFDFNEVLPEFERVVEIYNAWGSSECTEKEGNTRPITSDGKGGVKELAAGSVQAALKRGHRFGFVAGGLDDRGIYSQFYESDQRQYSPGLTAIIASKHTREALTAALFNRSCYATTGARIVVGLSVAGRHIGSELSTDEKPGLIVNRHIAGYVAATDGIASIELIRNGKVLTTFKADRDYAEFTYDDMEDLRKVVLEGPAEQSPFAYYYLRVTQTDDHIAWSSPIWVDLGPSPQVKLPKKK